MDFSKSMLFVQKITCLLLAMLYIGEVSPGDKNVINISALKGPIPT